jgi:hypothetical protein
VTHLSHDTTVRKKYKKLMYGINVTANRETMVPWGGEDARGGSVKIKRRHLKYRIWLEVIFHHLILEKRCWTFGFCYQKNDPPHTTKGA